MNNLDKLCLQRNDFRANISTSFGHLRTDGDLTDVTLACEDGSQVEAHKVVPAASSPFFMNLLKKNKHKQPLNMVLEGYFFATKKAKKLH